MRIIITGAAGYIGSHTLLKLLEIGHEVLGLDNFSNSEPRVYDYLRDITDKKFSTLKIDLRDSEALEIAVCGFNPEIIIHFAGLKSVTDSIENPIEYYQNNVVGTINLLKAMEHSGCKKLVFSSTASVYGFDNRPPFGEKAAVSPANPYASSKLMIENILSDWCRASNDRSAVSLRYFNPIGAHQSGLLHDCPLGKPSNIMPSILEVALNPGKPFGIFGTDFPTKDGTGVRDYIHVEDLASAHIAAIEFSSSQFGHEVINIGTGRGVSVLQLIEAFETIANITIPVRQLPRRLGDVAESFADVSKALAVLDWTCEHTLDDMCSSAFFASKARG